MTRSSKATKVGDARGTAALAAAAECDVAAVADLFSAIRVARRWDIKKLNAFARDGDVAGVVAMLALGVDPDAPDPGYGRTPLKAALDRRHHAVAAALLGAGANPGGGMLALAIGTWDAQSACLLLDGGADVHGEDGPPPVDGPPLHIAARGGNVEAVKLLLEAGANPWRRGVNADTARDVAAGPEVLRLLDEAMWGPSGMPIAEAGHVARTSLARTRIVTDALRGAVQTVIAASRAANWQMGIGPATLRQVSTALGAASDRLWEIANRLTPTASAYGEALADDLESTERDQRTIWKDSEFWLTGGR